MRAPSRRRSDELRVLTTVRLAFPSCQITESDDLSKSICRKCCDFLEEIRLFFEKCFAANQAQIIHFRKTRGSMLDLEAHINQYVRSYNPPIVPHIKLEPLVDFDNGDEDGDVSHDFPEPDDDDDEDYDQGGVHCDLT